jgi:heme exporter protein A
MSAALIATGIDAAAVLEASSVSHRYQPGRGLDPLSFVARAPGTVAVTGPNGSGKSTLLRIAAGLLRPSGGTLRLTVQGEEIPARARRTVIGFASPELAFYDELTTAENLRFAAEARGISDPERAAQVALARVMLDGRSNDRVAALSSGMKQRLRIAFALLDRPPILLLDEPGSHLDVEGRMLIESIVHDQEASGLVIIATNDPREWELAAQRIELRGRGLGHPA